MAVDATQGQHIAEELLQRAHLPEEAATIFRERVKQRPLFLRPSSPDPSRDARSRRQYDRLQKERARRKSNKPKPLSAKQKRSRGIYEIPKEQHKYAIYKPLHQMWCRYMREILGLSDADGKVSGRGHVDAVSAGSTLVSADYHGSLVEVVRSRCVSRVGITGIVLKDTKYTFEVVTRENVMKTVPKEHTVFRFEVPIDGTAVGGSCGRDAMERKPLSFEIYGSQFEIRAPDRANKKFRLHLERDL